MADNTTAKTFSCKTLVSGMGKGKTFVYRDDLKRFDEFYNIGKSQIKFAVDRENTVVDTYFNDTHEVIFRLLNTVHDDIPNYCTLILWGIGQPSRNDIKDFGMRYYIFECFTPFNSND